MRSARDVIQKLEKHKFKDNNKYDVKECRYCLMIYSDNINESYYLTMGTHNDTVMDKYQMYANQYYMLKKKDCDDLPKTSLVNLESIYYGEPVGMYIAVVPDGVFRDIIVKLKEYQSQKPDDNYIRIKDYI